MIGKLTGHIAYKTTDHVLLDVAGVGYLVFCSERTLSALPASGQVVALFTDLLVREDLMQIFGFLTLLEKEWYRLLMSVQGVGAKASLTILGTLGPDGVGRAIASGDWNAVRAAKGIGPKIAQRIVLDLKGKAPAVMVIDGAASQIIDTTTPTAQAVTQPVPMIALSTTVQADALSALSNLGYGPSEAAAAVAHAARQDGQADDTSALIQAALKHLAPKG